jgi:hypothetical protein
MNPNELLDHIRSGPAELMLDKALPFRPRTSSNPYDDFKEFLEALHSSETIRYVRCDSNRRLGIAEDEWVLLVKTLGSIKGIEHLRFNCRPGSRDFHPFQAVADAVNSAQSVLELVVEIENVRFPRDLSGLPALASALRKHTSLKEFSLMDLRSPLEAAQSAALSLDPILQALSVCPHLQLAFIMTPCASADAIRSLLQLPMDRFVSLALTPDQWLVVADEIRLGHCLIKELTLCMLQGASSKTSEAVEAVASAIREDRHLEFLELGVEDGFTDEAGVALAEALTTNKTLLKLLLNDNLFASASVHTKAYMGTQAYEAFGAMLRVNTSIELDLSALDADVVDQRLVDSRNQILIEQRLNEVGRGRLLASSQTPREEWVDALQELNARNDNDLFKVGCLYSLLQLNPLVCLSKLNNTTNSGPSTRLAKKQNKKRASEIVRYFRRLLLFAALSVFEIRQFRLFGSRNKK